jgi:hypothetical protein
MLSLIKKNAQAAKNASMFARLKFLNWKMGNPNP